MGAELVGGDTTSIGRRCDDVRATVCGVGGERGVPGLCDSSGVDGISGDGEARVAQGVATDAGPGASGGAAPLLCDCPSGSRLICALALSAHRALGVASGVTDQYGRHLSARYERPLSTAP